MTPDFRRRDLRGILGTVAKAMGVTYRTIHNRLHRARQAAGRGQAARLEDAETVERVTRAIEQRNAQLQQRTASAVAALNTITST